MAEAWDNLHEKLIAEFSDHNFDLDTLQLLQRTYYGGALAGVALLHDNLVDNPDWTRNEVEQAVNAFGLGLTRSLKQINRALYKMKEPTEPPKGGHLH